MNNIIDPTGGPSHFNRRNIRKGSDGKKQISLTLDDYVDFRLADYDEEEIQNAFLDWVKDESYFPKYEKWELTKENQVMFRVFYFEKENSAGLLSSTGNVLTQLKILPFGKVIKSSSKSFSAGDIIALPDNINDIQTTEEWVVWNKRMLVERPQPDIEEPEKYVGLITAWRANDKFVADKFNPDMDDEYTFIKNAFEFNVKYKP